MKQRETFNYFKNKTPGAEGFGKGTAINHQIRWQESSRSFIFNALEAQSTGSTEKSALFSSDWGGLQSTKRFRFIFFFLKSFGLDGTLFPKLCQDGLFFCFVFFSEFWMCFPVGEKLQPCCWKRLEFLRFPPRWKWDLWDCPTLRTGPQNPP